MSRHLHQADLIYLDQVIYYYFTAPFTTPFRICF